MKTFRLSENFLCQVLLAGFLCGSAAKVNAADCDRVNFAPARDFIAGSTPLGVVAGDFNNDRKPDFVVDNDSAVVVYRGNGSGGFLPPKTFFLGGFHESIVAGDFNGDGNLDLALPNYPERSVSVLLNDGSGGFGPAATFRAGALPRSIGVGDFNADGNLDMAVANGASDNVSVLLGNGRGRFSPPTDFPVGKGAINVAVGDFDRDGDLDLAISTYDSQELDILLGNGKGSFSPAHSYPLVGNGGSIMAADFNEDGALDLGVCVYNAFPNNQVTIFLGTGAGRFTAATSVPVVDPQGLAVADFNRDGHLDVAVGTFSFETVAVALGKGTGDFARTIEYRRLGPGKQFPIDLAAADFNLDGKPDLVTANFESGDASVLLNLPNVMIKAAGASASEGGKNIGIFHVIRTDCTEDPLLVRYSVSGTAEPGQDYKPLSGEVVIAAGTERANIRVLPLDDPRKEPAETVTVNLSDAPTYTVGPQNSATVTINDND